MLLENKHIAIIGGGPGGLTLARLLQQKGADVKVYERDVNKHVRIQGATLDLHFGSGLKAIEEAGLMEAFKEKYRPGADKGRVVDKHAIILYDEHDQDYDKDFGEQSFRPEIDRGNLRDVLLNSLQPDTVVWDCHLLSASRLDDKWKLEFKNGTTALADIVIGADGANSKIRPLITSVKNFYSGITILQGNVENAKTVAPNLNVLLKGGKLYVHSDGKYLHVSAKGDGSIDFYVSCKMDEHAIQNSGTNFSDSAQLLAWFTKEFSDWNCIWFELFENVSLPLLVRPQYCMPIDQTWSTQSNITLLGDAAHLMPPSGEGVNLAMLDALELSECLTSIDFNNLQTAIAAYEENMRSRAAQEATESLAGIEWMHAEGATEKLVQIFAGN